MKKTLLACAMAGLLSAQPAQAQDNAAVFRPAGSWVADFGDDYCRLFRTFSDGTNQVQLALERIQPGAFTRITLVGNGINPFRGADTIGYSFLPGGNTFRGRYIKSETGDGQPLLSFDPLVLMLAPPALTPPPPGTPPTPPVYNRAQELETVRAITGFALGEGLTDPVRFETGSLRAAVATMQTCADDLLKVWGLDPEKHKTMTAALVPNFVEEGWLPQGMIPFTEFEKFLGGANQVRLLVGADGKPTSCLVRTPTLSESLNRRICSILMEKATFQPAKDADGQPIASVWFGDPRFLGPRPRGGFGGGAPPGGG